MASGISHFFTELRRKKSSDFVPYAVRRRWIFRRKKRSQGGSTSSLDSSIEEENSPREEDSRRSATMEELTTVEECRAGVVELSSRRRKVRQIEEISISEG